MKIAGTTAATVTDLWAGVEAKIEHASTFEQAAQELANAIYEQFGESVVLARVYLTVPFGALPPANQTFVRNLAESANASSQLQETTPVLSLIGSFGQEAEWRDRRNSKGHVGIPLLSASFVDAIPMISRLLRELGLPVDWADHHDIEIMKKMGTGLFYVENAAEAVDHEGRKIIAVQDFVSAHQVRSVFGAGGAYPNGQMFVCVVFCRDLFDRGVSERFLPLINLFEEKTEALLGSGKVFSNA